MLTAVGCSDPPWRPHNVNNDASCVVGKTGGEVEKGTEVLKEGGKWQKVDNDESVLNGNMTHQMNA